MFSRVSQKLFTFVGTVLDRASHRAPVAGHFTQRGASDANQFRVRIVQPEEWIPQEAIIQMLNDVLFRGNPPWLCALMTIVRFPLHSFCKLHSSPEACSGGSA